MSAKYKITFTLAALAILILSAGIIYAQGNGNGGNGNGTSGNQSSANFSDDAQLHAYNNGGIGFVNAQTGEQWNDQARGNMRGNRQAGMNGNGIGFYTVLPPAAEAGLSAEAIEVMIDGWTDEQHAYAVYEVVIEQFGAVAPFVNIQRSEAQHIAAWELMFDRYAIPVPEVPNFGEMPQFASLAAACQVAADAEIANFELYDDMLATISEYPDMVQIATALRNASEFSHLPAFQNCAS